MLRWRIVRVIQLRFFFFFLGLLCLNRMEMDRTPLTFLIFWTFLLYLFALPLTIFSRLSSRGLSTILGLLFIFSILMLSA